MVISKEKQIKSLKQETLEYRQMEDKLNYWKKMGEVRQCEDKKKDVVGRIILGEGRLGYKKC